MVPTVFIKLSTMTQLSVLPALSKSGVNIATPELFSAIVGLIQLGTGVMVSITVTKAVQVLALLNVSRTVRVTGLGLFSTSLQSNASVGEPLILKLNCVPVHNSILLTFNSSCLGYVNKINEPN